MRSVLLAHIAATVALHSQVSATLELDRLTDHSLNRDTSLTADLLPYGALYLSGKLSHIVYVSFITSSHITLPEKRQIVKYPNSSSRQSV